MARKKSWFSSIKKALSLDSEEKKPKGENKSKKKWFGKDKPSVSDPPNPKTVEISDPHPFPPLENVKLVMSENEPINHYHSVGVLDITTADEEDVAAAQVEPEVLQSSVVSRFVGKSKEEVAAIKVQAAFRGYLARRALRALKGLVRLKSLVDGPSVNRQTANTLKCMQTLSRVQSQIQSRRIRMLEENRALQRQLLQKRAKELESLKIGDEWDDSSQSKEQIEASLQYKYGAAMRRERSLAYSYTHQQMWKKSAKSSDLLFMDPTNPHWGWSWLERWTAARPWEEKDPSSDRGGEITRSFARHHLISESPSSPGNQKQISNRHSPATPPSKMAAASSVSARKLKLAGSKVNALNQEDDSKSILSVQSESKYRRHSIGGASVRDDESLGSSTPVPSYLASTKSTKAKLRLGSSLGMESSNTSEKESAEKRRPFPPSPIRNRRHSGPPKFDSVPIAYDDM